MISRSAWTPRTTTVQIFNKESTCQQRKACFHVSPKNADYTSILMDVFSNFLFTITNYCSLKPTSPSSLSISAK